MHYLGKFENFMKNRVLQTYPPLRMNLALEIQREWKRFLETLP
jgi:hypothetical protein